MFYDKNNLLLIVALFIPVLFIITKWPSLKFVLLIAFLLCFIFGVNKHSSGDDSYLTKQIVLIYNDYILDLDLPEEIFNILTLNFTSNALFYSVYFLVLFLIGTISKYKAKKSNLIAKIIKLIFVFIFEIILSILLGAITAFILKLDITSNYLITIVPAFLIIIFLPSFYYPSDNKFYLTKIDSTLASIDKTTAIEKDKLVKLNA